MCGRTSAREVVRVFPRDEERFRSGQPEVCNSDWTRKNMEFVGPADAELWLMVLVALGHSGRRADVGGGDFRTSGRAEEIRDASGGAARVSRGARGGALGGCALVRRFGGISRLFEVIGRVAPAPRVARQGVEPPRRRPRPRYRVARQARHGVAARPRVHPRRGGVPSLVEDARHGVGASSRPPRGARGARHRRRRGRVPPLRAGQAHGGPHGRERLLRRGRAPLPRGRGRRRARGARRARPSDLALARARADPDRLPVRRQRVGHHSPRQATSSRALAHLRRKIRRRAA